MTTKEQERKALEKIKKIIEELGENSYVGTAFAGCFDDAEQNIEYDAAYSSLGRAEAAEKKELETREALQRQKPRTRNWPANWKTLSVATSWKSMPTRRSYTTAASGLRLVTKPPESWSWQRSRSKNRLWRS